MKRHLLYVFLFGGLAFPVVAFGAGNRNFTTEAVAGEAAQGTDSDRDGVADTVDQCLGTPRGARVDEKGCWSPVEIIFQPKGTTIDAGGDALLEELALLLKKNSGLGIEAQGFADGEERSQGGLGLAEARARAVRDFLVHKGISGERLTVVALEAPIAQAQGAAPPSSAAERRVLLIPVE